MLENKIKNILINILMDNTGSTTVILEAIISKMLLVNIIDQKEIRNINSLKWNGTTVKRESILSADKVDMSRNIVFINWDMLDCALKDQLTAGDVPIGKLIMDMDYRRKIIHKGKICSADEFRMFDISVQVGDYVKAYEIFKSDICLFFILEFFNMNHILENIME